MASEHFDELEVRNPADRESDLMSRLPAHLQSSIENCPGLATYLSGFNAASINSREALATLPVLRKSTLVDAQIADPPFGGFCNAEVFEGSRLFMSPGPVWEPQPAGIDPWHSARSLFAAGFRRGDLVHNSLSYHLTPGGFILDEGARAMGCNVFPAGVGNSEAQVTAINFYSPSGFVGTPDYLKILLDKAEEMGSPIISIKRALVSGGALFPSMRDEYRERGVLVLQAYATADLGVIAYESTDGDTPIAGMVCSENMIVEIVRPGSSEPVAPGEVGELVVTNFNEAYPLVRFATGDLSCLMEGQSPCGRTNMRIKGWMGRADQRTKVKGMFVDPRQVNEVMQTQEGIEKARLVVSRENDNDSILLRVQGSNIDAAALEVSLQTILKLKGQVELIDGELPNDGLVISDERDFENG